ncbi:MAG: DUF1292 domain-containing protein [Clostridia bacterium]|nr:DUF1292 domain-containing protein [Clostridia bacterium]
MEDNKIQFEDEDIITMIGEDGTEIDFVELADIVYKDGYYVVAQPLKAFDGIDEDACLVFKVEENGEEEAKFTVECDDEVVDGVLTEYERLLEEAEEEA